MNSLNNNIRLARERITFKEVDVKEANTKIQDLSSLIASSKSALKFCGKTAKPLPSICDASKTKDIFDANGNYLKTSCLIANSVNNEAAMQNCVVNGMTLYRFSDKAR